MANAVGLLAVEWVWLFVPFLGFVAPLAGAVVGWITFRRRGWRALLVTSAVWGAAWLVVWLTLPATSIGAAARVAGWLFFAPCLIGGVLSALVRRFAAGGRVVDQR